MPKTIKESSTYITEKSHPIVEQMEKEWPEIQRLKNMLMSRRDTAVDEPLEDAYLDVSNYGIMATIVKNGKWGK